MSRSIENLRRHVGNARCLATASQEERRKSTLQFNFFEALEIADSEQHHSRFLAFLLNPKAKHHQGDLFLSSFLQRFGMVPVSKSDLRVAQVTTEFCVPDGRIDIAILLPNSAIVCIENKVGAFEHGDQMDCYKRWLVSIASEAAPACLILLSPDGRGSRKQLTLPDHVRFRSISYADLATWLRELCVDLPERLAATLDMYAATCDRISTNKTTRVDDVNHPTKEIAAFLQEPETLEIAWDIADWMPVVKTSIFETFWGNVQDEIRRRLDEEVSRSGPHSRTAEWTVRLSSPVCDSGSWLSILPARSDEHSKEYYQVTAEALAGEPYPCLFGIYRSAPRNSALVERLSGGGFRHNDHWSGYRYFSSVNLPDFRITRENVLHLNRDNRSAAHPCATAVANQLFSLFSTHRSEIERLNDTVRRGT